MQRRWTGSHYLGLFWISTCALGMTSCGRPEQEGGAYRMADGPAPTAEATSIPGDDDSPGGGGDDDTSGPDDLPDPGFYITGSFPQDGAMMVPGQLLTRLYFSEPFECDLDTISASITGTHTGNVLELDSPRLSSDGYSVGFPTDLWSDDWKFVLDAEVSAPGCPGTDADWPLEYQATFTTDIYCGQTFNVFEGFTLVGLGGDSDAAEQLQILMDNSGESYPTAMILVGLPPTLYFPVDDFDTAIAGIALEESGNYSINANTGVASTIEGCSINSFGRLSCSADLAIFPLDLNASTTAYFYLHEAEITATVGEEGNLVEMEDFVLTGAISYYDLEILCSELGASDFCDLISLDVDLDGDGIEEAASVEINSDPAYVQLEQCQ